MHKRLIALILVMCIVLSGCSTGSSEELLEKADVGIYIPQMFLENAKAVSKLDDSLSFSYTYEKETDQEYCLVNMESFIVYLVVNTENISFSEDGLEELLYYSNIRIRMDDATSKESFDKKGKPKLSMQNVYCEALLSQEYYEDFTGTAVMIQDTYRNIGLFVGAKGREADLSKKQKRTIKSVADSLTTLQTASEDLTERVSITSRLTEGETASIAILNDRGNLDISKNVTVRTKPNSEVQKLIRDYNDILLDKQLKDPPKNYEWNAVIVKGENIDRFDIKIKDGAGNPFETGTRTYTMCLNDDTRIDVYLVEQSAKTYQLVFGQPTYESVLEVNK